MSRQNAHIHFWWSTVLPMLRTSDFDKLNLARWFGFRFKTIFANDPASPKNVPHIKSDLKKFQFVTLTKYTLDR